MGTENERREEIIMSLTVKFMHSPFIAAPAGTHIARCCRVIELGLQESKIYQTYYPKLLLAWELPYQYLSDGKLFLVSATYHLRLTERTQLMHVLESWRGQPFTAEEWDYFKKEGFTFKKLLDKPCLITLAHNHDPRYPQPWVQVTRIRPLPVGMKCPSLMNPALYYALDEHSEAAYAALPEGIRKKIQRENKTVGSPAAQSTPVTDPLAPLF
jgi:hypothetical protein